MSSCFPRRFAIARWQKDGWDEPCKSRGLRTVLWAAGGEIPPADPADNDFDRTSCLTLSILRREHEGDQHELVSLREELSRLHAGLFDAYMATRKVQHR
jgi:hypothetical protein